MDANIIQIILTIIAVGAIGGLKYYERLYGNKPESWDIQKFGLLIVVAFVIMVAEYAYGNAIAFPAEDIIVPAMGLFGAAYTMITAGKLTKNALTPKTATTVATTVSGWSPGFTVAPTFTKGISPCAVRLYANVGMNRDSTICGLKVDWNDGAGFFEDVPVTADGNAAMVHTYMYIQGTTKYTGHSYYPTFAVIQKDGTITYFNVGDKCCEIEVQAA